MHTDRYAVNMATQEAKVKSVSKSFRARRQPPAGQKPRRAATENKPGGNGKGTAKTAR